jgi:hypothetical protein
MMLAAFCLSACGSVQSVSQDSVKEKLARIKLGTTNTANIEALFGRQDGKDSDVWVYNFTDTAVELTATTTTGVSRILPVMPMTTATNTKALITVRFSQARTVKGLEVARYFEMPFTNEYWFLVENSAKNVLEVIARAGESSGFKVGALDTSAGTLSLEDVGSDAQIRIVLDQQLLHLTSTNPHSRQSNEYRIFIKRESAFADKLLTSELIQ